MERFTDSVWMLAPVLLSGIGGIALLLSSFLSHIRETGKEREQDASLRKLHILVGTVLTISVILALAAVWTKERSLTLFYIMDSIPIYFHVDALGRLFITLTSVIWLAVGIYAFIYMKHEGEERRFFGFFLLVYAVLLALEASGNLVTMYFFYELMTLTSMPLVLHNGLRESIMAALKYLFYSMCGAYCALFGIYFLYQYCDTLTFTAGGTLNMTVVSGNVLILQIAVFLMLIGFGTKAGMLPFHSWLTAAHPAAPAPASAALSSIIVKGGVLAIIRTVYYIVGPEFLKGSWVQTAWLVLTLLTVFMGSMLAYRERVFKKRLAYSTISQVSYILFGLALLNEEAMAGALLHVVFHAVIKCALFLTAGIFIFRTGKTRVEEYQGIGKRMGVTLWSYTFASLALIGIPPMSGFVSKWYLAQGALSSDTGVFRYLGPAVLLISALLTAGYLLPITISGFLPGEADTSMREKEPLDKMTVVLLILAICTVLLGVFPNPLIEYVFKIAVSLF
ncbi:MAG: proton-conducting membrane transporter [Ruminococcus sp.]|nr:proton-conducting membrane transporter [Ruminococcus sp.]